MKTKILFLVFNRPKLTETVLSRINEAKPHSLYVAADGPRDNEPNDVYKCKEVRKIATNMTSCPKVQYLFRKKNLGPLHGVSSAISWFFEYESEGIILEDDCLPDLSFFRFCDELLSRYRENQKIFMISGSNFIPQFQIQASYLFSRLALTWGWATWKRAWQYFDPFMKKWISHVNTNELEYFGKKRNLVSKLIQKEYLNPQSRTWGVQWRASFLVNKGLCVVPRNNLVRNIGFGHPDATHHKKPHKVSDLPVKPVQFPLRHAQQISPNRVFDEKSLDFYYDGVPCIGRS